MLMCTHQNKEQCNSPARFKNMYQESVCKVARMCNLYFSVLRLKLKISPAKFKKHPTSSPTSPYTKNYEYRNQTGKERFKSL